MINTHFHADFLAGHLEPAARTGAWIGYGRVAEAEYLIRALADGERIHLGDVVLEIMETPGHTPESISILVHAHAGDAVPYGVLTGDALFIGHDGRGPAPRPPCTERTWRRGRSQEARRARTSPMGRRGAC
ncbi:hypothetical protein GCM10018953_48410 [Streptosporangium nondiastaticum]